MILLKPIEEVIRTRRSVRSYTGQPIPPGVKDQINAYIDALNSPFPAKGIFRLIESGQGPGNMKLGTYGMIKGASVFIGAAVPNMAYAMETIGYELEELILYVTALGLGTCWLGGTFNREEFRKAIGVSDGLLFPAVTPIGYYEKKSLKETLVRGVVRADSRKPWEEMFFNGNFKTPLTESAAGDYAFPLEMVRRGPSASNKQPWRVVKDGSVYHFYECKTPGYSSAFNFDMQSLDMGIAACHFHLATIEKGLKGSFAFDIEPDAERPENVIYKFSWSVE